MSVGQRLRAARAGGVAGIAATALLVAAPGAMADHTADPSDACHGGEIVSHGLGTDCHDSAGAGDRPGASDRPGAKAPSGKHAGKTPDKKAPDKPAPDKQASGKTASDEQASGKQTSGKKASGEGPRERPGSAAGKPGPAKSGEPGGGARPGRPGPGASEPVAPEAKGRLDAHLIRGAGKVRAGATLNYRLDLDVRGTVGAVTVDLETNLGIWLFADVAHARAANIAERGPGRVLTAAGSGLRCAVDGGERVRCFADELTGARHVKLKLRLPDRTAAAELKVSGQVTADGEVDAFTDSAALSGSAAKSGHESDHKGDGNDHKADGNGHKGGRGHDGRGDGRPAGHGAGGANGVRPGHALPEVPVPALPPIRTVNVAALPLDDSPPRLPEVGPVGMPGAAPQRPVPAAAHEPRSEAKAAARSADGELPDGAAIALGLGGLAIMLAGGLYGRAALRKN